MDREIEIKDIQPGDHIKWNHPTEGDGLYGIVKDVEELEWNHDVPYLLVIMKVYQKDTSGIVVLRDYLSAKSKQYWPSNRAGYYFRLLHDSMHIRVFLTKREGVC